MTGLLQKFRLRSITRTLLGRHTVVGIDIGSSQLKVVELDLSAGQPLVARTLVAPTPPGSVGEREVDTPEAVGDVLRTLLDSAGIRTRLAAVALPLRSVVTRRVTLRARGRRALDEAIEREIDGLELATNVDWSIDWSHIDESSATGNHNILLVAAPTALARSYAACVRAADLLPCVVDVDAIVLQQLLRTQVLAPQRVIALVDMGAGHCCVNIVRNGVSAFHGSLDRPAEPPVTGAESWVVDIVEDLHHMLSFFWLGAGEDAIDEVWLSGGAAHRPEMRAQIETRLRARTKVIESAAEQGASPADFGPEYALALALALRGSDYV